MYINPRAACDAICPQRERQFIDRICSPSCDGHLRLEATTKSTSRRTIVLTCKYRWPKRGTLVNIQISIEDTIFYLRNHDYLITSCNALHIFVNLFTLVKINTQYWQFFLRLFLQSFFAYAVFFWQVEFSFIFKKLFSNLKKNLLIFF